MNWNITAFVADGIQRVGEHLATGGCKYTGDEKNIFEGEQIQKVNKF